ncbi:MAG: 2-oxoacid:acceptor oxidoreductase family protein [Candidatus Promineifilaceae bacterium]
MRKEIRISGFGGQGVILAGYMLGKALCLYEGYEVVMTQSYGPEARGGASSSNLVIADKTIAYPFVQHPDYLVAFSQEAFAKFSPTVKPNAVIFIDEDLVETPSTAGIYRVPATRLAEELGQRIAANTVMLGFFLTETGLVSFEAMSRAIDSSIKASAVALNLQALEKGQTFALAKASIAERKG